MRQVASVSAATVVQHWPKNRLRTGEASTRSPVGSLNRHLSRKFSKGSSQLDGRTTVRRRFVMSLRRRAESTPQLLYIVQIKNMGRLHSRYCTEVEKVRPMRQLPAARNKRIATRPSHHAK